MLAKLLRPPSLTFCKNAKKHRLKSAETVMSVMVTDRHNMAGSRMSACHSPEQEKKELGAKYDIKSSHDEILSADSLPLEVLHTRVIAWIATQKAAGSGAAKP
jgi:hypothetical protein